MESAPVPPSSTSLPSKPKSVSLPFEVVSASSPLLPVKLALRPSNSSARLAAPAAVRPNVTGKKNEPPTAQVMVSKDSNCAAVA